MGFALLNLNVASPQSSKCELRVEFGFSFFSYKLTHVCVDMDDTLTSRRDAFGCICITDGTRNYPQRKLRRWNYYY